MSEKPLVYPEIWRPSSLTEILNRHYEPPPWVLNPFLPKHAGLLCSGQPHSCKSLIWLAAGLESCIKHTIWGKYDATPVRRMLFVETEDPRWLIEDRIRGLAKGFGLDPDEDLSRYGFGLACTGPFNLTNSYIQLEHLIEDWRADWVVLSTLQGLIVNRDWNEQKEMGEVNATLVRLQRKCPCVVITHSPKSGSRRAAGTITQEANYLTLMHIAKRGTPANVVIDVEGDSKMGAELNFNLKLTLTNVPDLSGDRSQVQAVQHDNANEVMRYRILDWHAEHPEDSNATIAAVCDCTERYVRKVLGDKKGVQ